ncbi:MAG TPA: NUDIX domain-containing protein [Candidatus Nanoarchaeia archaeon]|nr:NUDIX domain-containing protein [Candidatus Nanoarchaeia archaeon]
MSIMVAAGGIILNNGKILLIENFYGWGFPKGRLEKYETIKETAVREIKEETGLKEFEIVRILGKITRPSKERTGEIITKDIYLFLVKTNSMQLEPEEECKWVNADEVINELYYKEDKVFLEKNLKLIKTFF